MKTIISIFALLLIFFPQSVCLAQRDIPSSARAREAIARVKPGLEKQLSGKGLTLGAPIFIRIFKKERALEVWLRADNEYKLFKIYPICTYGTGGLGPKTQQGDGKAPEGFYSVTPSNLNPNSKFHLSFNLGYPNSYDRANGRTGSALMVHGSCMSRGCFAMTNRGIEEIFALAEAAFRHGQSFFRVHIFPFRMTGENMEKHKDSEWYEFWSNLKEGHDLFETNGKIPPDVKVEGRRYIFVKE